MGLPAQLFLKRACSSHGVLYFVLKSDSHVGQCLDTQNGKVCKDARKSTFTCPSAAAAARRAGLGPPGSCPHFPGRKGSCRLEQHKGTRSVPLPQTPARETGRWREHAMGASLRRDMAVMQHGRPRRCNGRTFIFSGAEGEGAGTPRRVGCSSGAIRKPGTGSSLVYFRHFRGVPQLRHAPATQPV